MSRESWNTIKNSKSFYVRTYRKAGTILIGSLILNILLGLAIYYHHQHRPERDFYATSGMAPPIKLNARDEPNNSATYLLETDPTNDDEPKVIPQ